MNQYRYIVQRMAEHGWGPPEFKADSFIRTEQALVLVDAGMASRRGRTLVKFLREWLDGKRHPWSIGNDRASDLVFYVRIDMQDGLIPEATGMALLDELEQIRRTTGDAPLARPL